MKLLEQRQEPVHLALEFSAKSGDRWRLFAQDMPAAKVGPALAAEPASLEIYVRDLSGATRALVVAETDTLGFVRARVSRVCEIPLGLVSLTLGSGSRPTFLIDDDASMSALKVVPGAVLNLVAAADGPAIVREPGLTDQWPSFCPIPTTAPVGAGMAHGLSTSPYPTLPDSAFAASSEFNEHCKAHFARLHAPLGHEGWAPAPGQFKDAWVEIDLGAPRTIRAVQTQGNRMCMEWVSAYEVHASQDRASWSRVLAQLSPSPSYAFRGNTCVGNCCGLCGPCDCAGVVTRYLPVPLRARYVKLVVVRWSGQCAPELPFPFRCDAPVLRAELLVDPPDKEVPPVAVEPMERVVELQHLREVLIHQAGSMRELPERPCLSAPRAESW